MESFNNTYSTYLRKNILVAISFQSLKLNPANTHSPRINDVSTGDEEVT